MEDPFPQRCNLIVFQLNNSILTTEEVHGYALSKPSCSHPRPIQL
jgi:hypothetical protein